MFLVILSILTVLWGIFGPGLRKPVTLGGDVLLSAVQTISSADGKLITISHDSTGGGWFDQTEVRTIFADKRSTIVVTDLNANGAEIHQTTTMVSADGLAGSVTTDLDNNGMADRINTHILVNNGDSSRVENTTDTGNNGTLLDKVITTNDNAPLKYKAKAA